MQPFGLVEPSGGWREGEVSRTWRRGGCGKCEEAVPPREDVATLGRLADETSEEIPTEIYPFLLASANVGVPHWPNPTGSLRGREPTDWSMSSQPLWEGGRGEGGRDTPQYKGITHPESYKSAIPCCKKSFRGTKQRCTWKYLVWRTQVWQLGTTPDV